MRDADESVGAMPTAKGVAFFARAVRADPKQMRRVNKGEIRELVIGSPLFVQQT
jgi:hypothetical protein